MRLISRRKNISTIFCINNIEPLCLILGYYQLSRKNESILRKYIQREIKSIIRK